MEYHSIKCLNPRFITNRYTGKVILAECGKCESCLTKKNVRNKTKCQLEHLSHKHMVFVTLTYRRKFRPLIRLTPVEGTTQCDYHVWRFRQNVSFYNHNKKSYDYQAAFTDEYLGKVHFPDVLAKSQLQKKVKLSGDIFPCLDKRDGQLFIKRLRKCYPNEKIRYFVCGEYGPKHFAPHLHLCLWFSDEQTSKTIHQNIRACWTFGRVDSSVSNGRSIGYVSSYVNSNQYLPCIYKISGTKPFSCHSFYLGEHVLSDENEILSKENYLGFAKRRIRRDGFNSEVSLWRSLTARFFPKCKGYERKSEYERVYASRIYATIRDWTKETCPLYQARFITDYVMLHDFQHDIPVLNDLLQYFRCNYGYYICSESMERDKYVTPCIDDWDKFERCIYMEIRYSYNFLKNICHGIDTYEYVLEQVRRIDEFYKTIEYDNLINQLTIERDMSCVNKDSSFIYRQMFHNILDLDELVTSPNFLTYKKLTKERFENYTKHKELNDLNKIFNY